MKIFNLLLVLSLLFSSCQKKEFINNEEKILISSVDDLNTQNPFHQVLLQKKDYLYKYDFWKKDSTYAKSNIRQLTKGDRINFNNRDQLIFTENYTLFENLVLFYNNSKILSFVETKRGQELKKDDFIKKVEGRQFVTHVSELKTPNSEFEIREILTFKNKNIEFVWEYFYSEQLMYTETESVPYEFYNVDSQLFIIPSNQDNPYPILHVKNVSKTKIELSHFTEFETVTKNYISTSFKPKSDKINYFSLCNDAYQSIYYVGKEVRYAKGVEYLKDYLKNGAPKIDNNGYINLHFTINCRGEVGRFGLELLDVEYNSTDFNSEIIKHIIDKVRHLKNWKNLSKVDHRGSKDVRKFLLIKIRDNEIVEVCQ